MAKEKRDGIFLRAASVFDLPGDVAGLTNIEICGTREVLIENHKGILEYDDTILCVNAGRHLLTIEGQNLVISAMNDLGLRLSGTIETVTFKPM